VCLQEDENHRAKKLNYHKDWTDAQMQQRCELAEITNIQEAAAANPPSTNADVQWQVSGAKAHAKHHLVAEDADIYAGHNYIFWTRQKDWKMEARASFKRDGVKIINSSTGEQVTWRTLKSLGWQYKLYRWYPKPFSVLLEKEMQKEVWEVLKRPWGVTFNEQNGGGAAFPEGGGGLGAVGVAWCLCKMEPPYQAAPR
jgi:hypothetical protein